MSVKSLAGTIETIEAAGQSGDTSGLEDLAVQLRRDIAEMYQRQRDMLEGIGSQFADDGDPRGIQVRDLIGQVTQEANQFAPELADRPNPQTQPGDPNPVAVADFERDELVGTVQTGQSGGRGTDESKGKSGSSSKSKKD